MHNRLIVILIFYLNVATTKADAPKVCIDTLGCIEGVYQAGNEVEKYEAFYSVPFAKPPINELRFKPPVPVEPWNGTLLAKEPRAECIQKNFLLTPLKPTGDEDCLYLNVYRPAERSNEKLPVLVYIHGGSFLFGTPNREFYGPEYFMDTKEVILVIPAYRLGPFGFLSTGDEHMTGNFGLKDQNLALKWVQSHISAFGGDPSRVTIFGHSSGGLSVHLHMLSPASENLFRNAAPISGLANAVWALPIDQKAQTIQLATAAGIPNASKLPSEELVNALRKVPADKLMNASPLTDFRPTIEKDSWPQPFLTTNVRELLNSNPPKTVPWIVGDTSSKGEGVVIALKLAADPAMQAAFNENFDESFKLLTFLPAGESKEVNDVVERLVAEYMGGVRVLNDDTMDGFLELLGDANSDYPIYKTFADNVESSNGRLPTGYLKFNYSGPYSFSPLYTGSTKHFGAVHVDDVFFLFTVPVEGSHVYPKSSPEAALVKRYVGIYVELAKNGEVEVFKNIQTCSKALFEKQGFCDYLSIVKQAEPFQVDNAWNIERMKLWEYVYNTFY